MNDSCEPGRRLRILLPCFAWDTHIQTVVPLAWALRTAGHDVLLATQPKMVGSVTGAGLPAVAIGEDTEFVDLMGRIGSDLQVHASGIDLDDPAKGENWEYLLGQQSTLVPTFYSLVNDDPFVDGLVRLTRQWRPDLIIWEQFTFAGALAAAATGTPHGRLVWGPDLLTRMRRDFLRARDRQHPAHRDDPLREWFEWTGDRLGFEYSEELTTGQFTVDMMPPSLRLPTDLTVVPMQYLPYNGPSLIPSWVLEPPSIPRVCLTVGVSAELTVGHRVVLPEVLDEFANLNAEVVVTLSQKDQSTLDRIPDNIRVVDFVPLNALLGTCSAIVHHGGAGTSASAAINGVPQILVGEMYDATLRGHQVRAGGNGIVLDPNQVDARAIRVAVDQVLAEPEYRARAIALSEEIRRGPTPAEVVPRLAEFATGRTGPKFWDGHARR